MSDTKDISQLETEFTEMKSYSDAQFTTIVDLQKKISKLESENKSLKIMLEGNLPGLGFNAPDLTLGISKEQLICEVQIEFLKNIAIVRELSLEETRKFAMFEEILDKIRKDPTKRDSNVEALDDNTLLKLVGSNDITT